MKDAGTRGKTSRTSPDPDAARQGVAKPPATGYKIYVRVPTRRDGKALTAAQVRKFLRDFAALLDDPGRSITVEPFSEVHTDVDRGPEPEYEGAHPGKKPVAEPDEYPHPYGGPDSPLIPFYVCHHK